MNGKRIYLNRHRSRAPTTCIYKYLYINDTQNKIKQEIFFYTTKITNNRSVGGLIKNVYKI